MDELEDAVTEEILLRKEVSVSSELGLQSRERPRTCKYMHVEVVWISVL